MTLTNCIFQENFADYGAGVSGTSPAGGVTLINCTFTGNDAEIDGGGAYFKNTDHVVTGCVFTDNSSAMFGGGLSSASTTDMQITGTVSGCTFVGNTATNGGGAVRIIDWGDRDQVTFSYCRFLGNSSADGGAICVGAGASTALINCVFSGNDAQRGGAILSDSAAALWYCNVLSMVNCTLSGNTASYGRSMASTGYSVSYGSQINVVNSILWNGGSEIWDNDGSTYDITYSDVTDGWTGVGNIAADPVFVDADGADDILGTLDDDMRLAWGSPCIETGNTWAVPGDVSEDLDHNCRIANGDERDNADVDMGAYEFVGPCAVFCDESGDCDEGYYCETPPGDCAGR